jgi:hypothetical protein
LINYREIGASSYYRKEKEREAHEGGARWGAEDNFHHLEPYYTAHLEPGTTPHTYML